MIIRIDRMRIRACHGVLPQERVVGQDFEVTVELECPYSGEDSIEATVNYAEVADTIRREMLIPSQLIEHAAWRIGRAIRREFPSVQGGRVTVTKLRPPMPAELAGVSVTLGF